MLSLSGFIDAAQDIANVATLGAYKKKRRRRNYDYYELDSTGRVRGRRTRGSNDESVLENFMENAAKIFAALKVWFLEKIEYFPILLAAISAMLVIIFSVLEYGDDLGDAKRYHIGAYSCLGIYFFFSFLGAFIHDYDMRWALIAPFFEIVVYVGYFLFYFFYQLPINVMAMGIGFTFLSIILYGLSNISQINDARQEKLAEDSLNLGITAIVFLILWWLIYPTAQAVGINELMEDNWPTNIFTGKEFLFLEGGGEESRIDDPFAAWSSDNLNTDGRAPIFF